MKDCCVCQKKNSAYKCPTCKQFYCSATCCKSHKSVGCEPPPAKVPTESREPVKYNFPTEDTVPLEKLELLGHSQEIKECLKNPHVRDIARAILNDSNPTKAIALAMTEPIFVELADACLRVVEPIDNYKT
ncbi:zinc finger HIT domain-containing protein 3 [Microplitis demolitor]|uniref:zinc finger HIT domain-containing protein 3 n=1 Tax=Microplitis demolitor TaxID=69319 RepID=UPI0004CD9CD9|nr:zinc finger HIT domain-containing protein 3 [Microplitis demolitor]